MFELYSLCGLGGYTEFTTKYLDYPLHRQHRNKIIAAVKDGIGVFSLHLYSTLHTERKFVLDLQPKRKSIYN